jgi:hypothetical protein
MKTKTIPACVLILGVFLFLVNGCDKQPFMAGEDAIITLSAESLDIALGGSIRIFIIGYDSDGSLLWDGTRVDLTIENGSLNVSTVELTDGKASVTATADGGRGEMTISARSGNAQAEPLVINVGQVTEVQQIVADLNPPVLPYDGGQMEITVKIYDAYFDPIPGISVVLESDTGSLQSKGAALTTDDSGTVTDYLQTAQSGTVTIYCGDKTKTVDITLEEQPEPNLPPTAEFTFSPVEPVSGDEVYFNASESYDEDGFIRRYVWDFGDGTSGSGKKPVHIFDLENLSNQTYMVTLTVYDDDDATDSISYQVTVYQKSGKKGR